ncbi:MAG: ATP-binding protein [Candidatus Eremiobacteraeota bacterium]|nr:ATP-binding protein [Candidatus Eremiobacteraeota bacterium]
MITEEFNRSATGEHPFLRVRIPSRPRFVRKVRRELADFAQRHHIDRTDLIEFTFAVGEALANAIEHSGTTGMIEITFSVEREKIEATITDSGRGMRGNAANLRFPDAYAERGRGFPIMKHCADIFAVSTLPGDGTSVTLGRRLTHAPAVS